jgi:hypothetical protein
MTFVTFAEMRSGDDLRWVGWLSETEPVPTRADPDPSVSTHIAFFTNLGTLTLIGLAGLLFYLGRRSLKAENTRRGANVLWDVLSFWPHAAHPFVPPAYSQFAVHDLRRRIVFHLSSPDVPKGEPKPPPRATSVVISAHSQGSLVTLAALLWLSPEHLARVGLVTYGSQLQVAYPRGFPAFVDFELLQRVQASLGRRWVNLYRETDPIAGPVLSWHRTRMTARPTAGSLVSYRLESPDAPTADTYPFPSTGRRESGHDWRVLDPPPVDEQRQLAKLTLLSRHSGYPSSDDYPPAVSQVKPA